MSLFLLLYLRLLYEFSAYGGGDEDQDEDCLPPPPLPLPPRIGPLLYLPKPPPLPRPPPLPPPLGGEDDDVDGGGEPDRPGEFESAVE